jgi:hypothetical protein
MSVVVCAAAAFVRTTAMPTVRIEIIAWIIGQLFGPETWLIVTGRTFWLTAPLQ